MSFRATRKDQSGFRTGGRTYRRYAVQVNKENTVASTGEAPRGIGVRDLLEAGLHFGHQTKRWNPKMKRYIFDKRSGIHIIDLAKSLVKLNEALEFVHDTVASGRKLLLVGTKKQAQQVVKELATEYGQHYVTNRWLGGTLTNSVTIRNSVRRMRELEKLEEDGSFATMHKKEASSMRRELEKLRKNLSGVADMSALPGALFVVDINRESIAVAEANKLNIPVIAIVDTNCDPDPIEYVIPGNDDAIRAVKLVAASLADTLKKASEEYARIAAEIARKKEAEMAAQEAKQAKKAQADAGAAKEETKAKKTAGKAVSTESKTKKAKPRKPTARKKIEDKPEKKKDVEPVADEQPAPTAEEIKPEADAGEAAKVEGE